jgi:hypothetical protein
MSNSFLEALNNDRNTKRKPKILLINKEGNYTLRFCANREKPDSIPYVKIFLHFNFLHPNYNKSGTFRCIGKDCPLCRVAKEKQHKKDPNAWKYRANIMFLYYVADAKENFYYIRLSATAQDAVFKAMQAKAKSGVNPTDLQNGRMARFTLDKVDNKTKYQCSFLNDTHKVSENIINELENAPDLNKIYKFYSKEDLEKIVRGEKLVFNFDTEDSDSDFQQDQKPAPVIKLYDAEDSEHQNKISKFEEAKLKIKKGLGE